MWKSMMGKIEVRLDQRSRMTLPEEIRKHLGLAKNDDVWFDIKQNGEIIVGRIEVKKKIIE